MVCIWFIVRKKYTKFKKGTSVRSVVRLRDRKKNTIIQLELYLRQHYFMLQSVFKVQPLIQ